ncbi:oxygenase MpaB family protein [Peteryoungia ipomoeae]|uniref:DUF2236 domain-containing protein n=1 Tax=Peteryoungia ipomoeae TaxID=1210932 RepID=A0A4S8P406_9HYPH|nr:oxygenase MpaB family protein [Peteryoungia ipomoeae]THV24688.1 DUF2236 domain-containing protein [Peteryoungia ipomoeae]
MQRILSPLPLPGIVSRRLDQRFVELATPQGMNFDFASPAMEEALVPASSISWQVFKNPVTVFVGGITAVVLELAEPQVRDGVWQHSSFRTAALPRTQRTGLAAMVTVYGARSKAEAMISAVNRRHQTVTGTTREGQAYRADDPVLLDWVQATASFGFLQAYHRYARPLSDNARNRFLAEGKNAAALYGAHNAPASLEEMDRLFETMRPRLRRSDVVFEFLDMIADVPILSPTLRPFQKLLTRAATSLLPQWVHTHLGLDDNHQLSRAQFAIVQSLAFAAERILLPSSPPVQACRRLSLPDDYLYRNAPAL